MPTSPFTNDFRREFEAETLSLLHKRFLWFTGVVSGLGILAIIAQIVWTLVTQTPGSVSAEEQTAGKVALGVALLSLAAYVTAYLIVLLGHVSRERVLWLVFWLVVFDGVLHIALSTWWPGKGPGMFGVLLTHLLACCFLPWTPTQALAPIVVLVAVKALATTFFTKVGADGKLPVPLMVFTIVMSPLAGLPGTLICWLRHSRRMEQFKLRSLATRYGEFRRELIDARRIHESLFPKPRTSGDVQFVYLYEPMRQIGGDFLFIAASPTDDGRGETLSVVLIDVTGHGIPAALTVNRLHGELSRLFAEDPAIRPGDVLRLLNRYVHLTLANHSVYVTALCVRIDPQHDALEYASGGHPTAFLRGVDGTVEELDSTSFVLGACPDTEFEPMPRTHRFHAGDSLVAYTDGALEAKDKDGRMLGTRGMQRVVASPGYCPCGSWPQVIIGAVEQHRFGPPADDTLVVEIFRPVGGATAAMQSRIIYVDEDGESGQGVMAGGRTVSP